MSSEFDDKGSEIEPGSGFTIDLSEVGDVKYESVPIGMYPVVVTGLEFEYSKSGNPMWSWVLEISEGEYADKKVFFYTVFSGAGLPYTKKTLSRILPELLEAKFDPSEIAANGDLIGKEFRARMARRKGEDGATEVRDLFPSQEGGF